MDKLQKVRKEIERRKAINSGGKDSEYMRGVMACYSEVLAIFDFDFEEEPASEDLEKAAVEWFNSVKYKSDLSGTPINAFKAGVQWQKEHLWKPADGDDLPEIDREVIALLDNGKVVFAHRPPEYWDGKDIVTGKVTRNYPKTYDKGGWNIPNVVFWLDLDIPKL